MIKIAPSILSADLGHLVRDVERVERGGADYLHIDIMDGHFVPNMTFGPGLVAALRPRSKMIFDVHLMIEQPDRYIDHFIEAGADVLTVHAEACLHLYRTVTYIKEKGVRAGVALNPATGPQVLEYILPVVDLVLVMTVNPGFAGQAFISRVVPKISVIKKMVEQSGSLVEIEVDGGINEKNAPLVVQAGATVLVAGSAVFGAPDPAQVISQIRRATRSFL